MEKLINYLMAFTGKELTLTELATELDVEELKLADELESSLGTTDNSLSKKIKIVYKYFDENNKEIKYPRVNKSGGSSKIHQIKNLQHLTEERSLELFLAEFVFGMKPTFGLIDKSEIGGLWTHAWLMAKFDEVPHYLQQDLTEIIKKINVNTLDTRLENGIFTATLGFYNTRGVGEDLNLNKAIAKAIRDFLIQTSSIFIVDQCFDNGASFEFRGPISPLFYKEEDAQVYIKDKLIENPKMAYEMRRLKNALP